MVLIADSGSTKTDWSLVEGRRIVVEINTQGINPYSQSPDDITYILRNELVNKLNSFSNSALNISSIFFYGSGCRGEMIPVMSDVMREVFNNVCEIEVESDLMGAARALCGHDPGIACILGTGSNSCLYDGNNIVNNTPPLGYILGDEGGGAVLGRDFVNALFKGRLSENLRLEFTKFTGLTLDDVIDRVYRRPLPNRFLASLSTFIHQHMDDTALQRVVGDNFRLFIRRNILPYNHPELSLNFIGGIAFTYKPFLEKAVKDDGFILGEIMRSPMEGLIEYHG